ncbi:MAG: cation-translocating P-type ATPase, partial [Elusimicrobiota bacterium]|nr:cation-translocating P-type ATPase [Elusimicrobiota bacterium]
MTPAVPVKKFKRAVIPLEGVHCASCVARLENGLNSLPGVAGVSVNLPSRTAFLSYDPALADAKSISGRIEELGYKALAFSESAAAAENTALAELEREKNIFLRRFLLGLALTSFLLLDFVSPINPYTMMTVAGLAWWFAGKHFHQGFLRALKAHTADMNSLVSLSTSVTYFYGVIVTLFPTQGMHYHAQWHEVGMLVTFINLGRWLEARSKNKAGEAVAKLFKIAPKFARRLRDGREQTVPVAEILPGDLVFLRPGEQVPVDGRVTGGFSAIDESLLTGEAVPVEKEAGARVYAGTINKTGALEFTAEGVGEDTVLMKIIKAVEESQAEKSAVQHMVDRISAWFVPAVFLIAAAAAGFWFHYYDLARAAGIFAAVLAVACPCAMGLAVPMAVAVGFGRAASAGILIRNADVLERASGVDVVIFDKTGTVTEGRLHLDGLHPFETTEKKLLQLLSSAEEKSEHPFAEAVRRQAKEAKVSPLPLTAFEAV